MTLYRSGLCLLNRPEMFAIADVTRMTTCPSSEQYLLKACQSVASNRNTP